jgi:NADH dehydrogenase FAD-containing subunit
LLSDDGSVLPFGTLVWWSAGLKEVEFTNSLTGILPKSRNGRIIVDEYLRVKGYEGSILVGLLLNFFLYSYSKDKLTSLICIGLG